MCATTIRNTLCKIIKRLWKINEVQNREFIESSRFQPYLDFINRPVICETRSASPNFFRYVRNTSKRVIGLIATFLKATRSTNNCHVVSSVS